MFIEVYSIPLVKYNCDIKSHMIPENLRTINVSDISIIQPDSLDRAEIVLKTGELRFHTVGSYEEIINRLNGSGIEINRHLPPD